MFSIAVFVQHMQDDPSISFMESCNWFTQLEKFSHVSLNISNWVQRTRNGYIFNTLLVFSGRLLSGHHYKHETGLDEGWTLFILSLISLWFASTILNNFVLTTNCLIFYPWYSSNIYTKKEVTFNATFLKNSIYRRQIFMHYRILLVMEILLYFFSPHSLWWKEKCPYKCNRVVFWHFLK